MIDRDAIGNLDQIASAIASVVANGPAAGCRALDLRALDGIDVRLLPDRGFDAGAAWFRGVPLAWISPVGEHAPIDNPRELDWLRAFGGGLMVTCGLRNVGAPSEGHGQHGELSMQRAHVRAVERSERAISARARVAEVSALGVHLEVERTWTTAVGEGRLELVDVVRNRGREDEPVPQLYHVNLGAPVWSPGATLTLDARATHPRDEAAAPFADRWDEAPGVVAGADERVFEHEVVPGPDGWGSATVTSPAAGIELTVRWDLATLPRLWQWVHPAPGMGVLGLEPANCSVLGRAADRAAGRLPVLRAGETRTTRLEILARALPRTGDVR
ncbi:MAG: hypothetical protein QOC64_2005 [Solirubrobacteraceae bacterium]|nr:hypothetical protein [Solirubrobacteraceae bacterium]